MQDSPTGSATPRSSSRFKWVLGGVLLLCVGGCTYRIATILLFPPTIRISPETTVVDGPLGPDGFVDYFAVINEQMAAGVTAENNAAIPLVQALGPTALEGAADEIYSLLEIPLPEIGAQHIVSSTGFGQVPTEPMGMGAVDASLDQTMSRPWARDEFPDTSAWVDVNAAPLELVHEAAQREKFYLPLVPAPGNPGLINVPLLLQHARTIARLLTTRAMLQLGEGDLNGANQDLLACHQLAGHVGRAPFLLNALLAMAIDAMAFKSDGALLSDPRLTSEQARRMLTERQSLRPLPDVARIIDTDERFMMIDTVYRLLRGGANPAAGIAPVSVVGIDGNVALTSMNDLYDEAAAALRIEAFAERRSQLEAIDQDLKARITAGKNPVASVLLAVIGARSAASRQMSDTLLALLAPAILSAQTAEDRATARRRLLIVGCALAVHRAEQGEYPASLDGLTPDLLENVPLDPFGDQPLIYRRTEEGGYRLYSVGENLKDDGGATADSEPKGDDVLLAVPVLQ